VAKPTVLVTGGPADVLAECVMALLAQYAIP
jgi:NAD(P)H-hydrate repair Nnr-like enzyme with NAD(P)H-hydrate dehydratase domain